MTGPLHASVGVERGRLSLLVELAVAPGEVVAVLGPNGAGKTTLLHTLAGLVALTAGRIEVAGTVYDEPGRARFLPPERRAVGLVPQEHLLFPHLSVLDNVAFGPAVRGVPRRLARARAGVELDRVGLGGLAGERPRTLSGGQAQRVALARALALDPALLLLDEPLAALDARTRAEVRAVLSAQLRGGGSSGSSGSSGLSGLSGSSGSSGQGSPPALLVTHDALDALVLADRLVVLEEGRVVQQGAPGEVARQPRTDYVARLVGLNLVRGEGEGSSVRTGPGRLVVPTAVAGPVLVAFPPSAVTLSRAAPESSARNVWSGRVGALAPHGDLVRVEVAGLDLGQPLLADVTPAAVAELGLVPGGAVWASVKASELVVYPDAAPTLAS